MLTKAELHRLRSLREKKTREALGLFVIEGEKVVAELLTAGFPFVELYATDAWRDPRDAAGTTSLRARSITTDEMARASHFPTPASVLAVGRLKPAPLLPDTLTRGFTLALDGVQDAGNVGALLRIADWFAFDRVVLSPDCADRFHQKVINASMGSFARVVTHTADLGPAFAQLAAAAPGVPVIGCDLVGNGVHGVPALRDAVVVIGSEGRGLSPAVKERVTQFVTIPRYGHAESLNAAVAAAIVCDNLRRAGGRVES